jgi:hypothetical protein
MAQIYATSRALSHLPRKQLLLFGSLGQALAWFPLFMLPLLLTDQAVVLFIICVMAYAALGHMTVPAWNSLITDIVGTNLRGQSFGRRGPAHGGRQLRRPSPAADSFYTSAGAGPQLGAALP